MNIAQIGFIITTLGEIILGISVIRVHSKLGFEHKIDKAVLDEINKEKLITIAGIIFIAVGALIQLASPLFSV